MLLKAIGLGVLGYAGFHLFMRKGTTHHPAFAENEANIDHTDVRDAGPDAMRDATEREWSKTDQESDESFPASDPPANY